MCYLKTSDRIGNLFAKRYNFSSLNKSNHFFLFKLVQISPNLVNDSPSISVSYIS